MKILIVEDDKALSRGIAMSLGSAAYGTESTAKDAAKKGTGSLAKSGAQDTSNSTRETHKTEILQAYTLAEADSLFTDDVDLIILDINLPDGSGLDYCRKIREKSRVPIIFLTANDMETDIVSGLESGADDYITKPFSLAVLRARVNAVLRRKFSESPQPAADGEIASSEVFKSGRFSFDFENMKFEAGGSRAELSKTEQRLLRVFTQNAGRTLTRDMLLSRVWDDTEFV